MLSIAKLKSGRFVIPIIYLVVGVIWILISDRVLIALAFHTDEYLYNLLNSAKGVIYVFVTALALGLLISKFERNLVNSERQYRNMYLSNPYPIWFLDPISYQFISVNDAASFYYGYSKEEFKNMTIFDIHQALEIPAVKHFFSKSHAAGYEFAKWCHLKKDGKQIYVNISSLLTILDEKPAIMVFVIDITEKVAFEQDLVKSQIELESTLSSISDSYFTVNRDWVITSANSNFYERTSTSAEVIGKTVKSTFPDAEESVIFQAGTRAMQEGIPTKIEAYYASLKKWLHVACYPTQEGIAVYFTDITDRKEREAEIIRQNELLKKVSWLNSHEIRKPVASMISLVELLKTSSDPIETTQIIERIQECTSTLDDLLHEINKLASKI
jgi:PAS domain S-box-containing protein